MDQNNNKIKNDLEKIINGLKFRIQVIEENKKCFYEKNQRMNFYCDGRIDAFSFAIEQIENILEVM